jgi:hypothetical protein
MITKFKTFEIINKPLIRDYVILNIDWEDEEFNNYINNNIGNIYTIFSSESMRVSYKNPPKNVRKYFNYNKSTGYYRDFPLSYIVYFSPNKEDCEAYLSSKKYNL